MGTEEQEKKGDTIMEYIRYTQYGIEKLGFPLLVCAFLAFVLFWKLEKMSYKLDRCIRNERAIMQKLGIPVIVAPDQWEEK